MPVPTASASALPWQKINIQAIFVCAYLAGIGGSLLLKGVEVTLVALPIAALCVGLPLTKLTGARWALLLVTCGFVLLGLSLGTMRSQAIDSSELRQLAGKQVSLEVTVLRAPRIGLGKVSFLANVEQGVFRGNHFIVNEKVLVELYCNGDCRGEVASLSEGMRCMVSGSLRELQPDPGSDFDYSLYLARRGVHTVIASRPGSYQQLEPRGGLAGLVDRLRRHSRQSLEEGSRGAAGALLKGMVLGDTSDVPDDVVDALRDSGLLHLLAVSGQNVVLLGFVIMLICRLLMVSISVAAAVAIITVCFYVPLTGADPSIVRAGIVGILGLIAMLLGRPALRYYLLALSAAVLLTHNPNNLFEPGFQLSYAAVLAIFYIAPAITRLLAFLPGLLAEAVAVSAAAGLATAPITLAHFHQVSLVTVSANVAAAPVAGPVMFMGVLSVMAAPISMSVSWLLNLAASCCTGYLIAVAYFFAALPGAVYVGAAPGMLAIFLFYGMLLALATTIRKTVMFQSASLSRLVLPWAVALTLLLVCVGFSCLAGLDHDPPVDYTVSFLDVGQGDATLIQVPGGATVLVDGGPGAVVLDRLKQSGVQRIDAVILSHTHADHIEGLSMVLEKYDVNAVYDAAAPSTSPLYADFLRVVERKKIPYNVVRRGDSFTFGELQLEIFSPGTELIGDDANANSVVLAARYEDIDVLLPGDAESDILASLALPAVEALKVSHHGSRDDGLNRLLDKLKPEVSVISVAAGNDYGHPADTTLDTLAAAQALIYRTDRDGTVRLSFNGEHLVIDTDR